jgi:hypothetical protein
VKFVLRKEHDDLSLSDEKKCARSLKWVFFGLFSCFVICWILFDLEAVDFA